MQTTETYQLKRELVVKGIAPRSKNGRSTELQTKADSNKDLGKNKDNLFGELSSKDSSSDHRPSLSQFPGLLSDWKVRVEMKSAIPTLFTLVCSLSPPR